MPPADASRPAFLAGAGGFWYIGGDARADRCPHGGGVRRGGRVAKEAVMGRSVLVVDDEPNIVISLQFLLQQAGFDVRVAKNGEEALKAVAERAPDLVLLDVMTPVRDGYDVCERIRANPDLKGVRIVMLTARSREVEREKALALGADDYVTKPFSTRELVERVRRMLEAENR
jgi:DNA-binding response OmpR family regulator